MTRLSFTVRAIVTAVAGLLCASMPPINQAVANAAEVKVLASVALTSVLDELTPAFERASGNRVVVVYGSCCQPEKARS